MIKLDEDALKCDLAETYQIFNYKQQPPLVVAVFSYGLRDNSRIKLKMNGNTVPLETMLIASISDRLGLLLWFQSKDGQKGNNRPISIVDELVGNTKKETVSFDSGEEFEKARQQMIRGET